jgi:hypothetical protein
MTRPGLGWPDEYVDEVATEQARLRALIQANRDVIRNCRTLGSDITITPDGAERIIDAAERLLSRHNDAVCLIRHRQPCDDLTDIADILGDDR